MKYLKLFEKFISSIETINLDETGERSYTIEKNENVYKVVRSGSQDFIDKGFGGYDDKDLLSKTFSNKVEAKDAIGKFIEDNYFNMDKI